MNVSVTYRKRGNRWHIRFRAKGRKEVIKSLPGSIPEKDIARKASWLKVECDMDRFDPWAELLTSEMQPGE